MKKSKHHHVSHVAAVIYAHRYGWKCYWCGCKLTVDTITGDHLVPLCEGGSDREPNIVPSCRSCNEKRGNERAYG